MLTMAVMGGCSSDTAEGADDEWTSGNVSISFKASADDSPTRSSALINSTTDLQTAGQFAVWAWMLDQTKQGATAQPMFSEHNGQALYGTYVTYDGSKWTTDQTYYWPRPRYRVDFYAVYPQTANFVPSTKTLDYSTTGIDGHTDLMYATASGQRSGYDESETHKDVELQFHHALAKVRFTANKSGDLSVSISELTLHNVEYQGSLRLPAPSESYTDYIYWNTTASGLTNYTVLQNANITLTDEAQTLTTDDNTLMVMPQYHMAWDYESKTIEENDNASYSWAKGSYLKVRCTISKGGSPVVNDGYIYCPITLQDFQAGYTYTYNLPFGAGYNDQGHTTITPMNITVTVSDWNGVQVAGSISATAE